MPVVEAAGPSSRGHLQGSAELAAVETVDFFLAPGPVPEPQEPLIPEVVLEVEPVTELEVALEL
jgi:hypothetical protein